MIASVSLRLAVLAASVSVVGVANAADLVAKSPLTSVAQPAVDGVNGKVSGFGGTYANKSLYGGQGALSLPLAQQYGLQLDAAAGSFDHRSFAGAGAHLFWRDPSRALIGVYSGYTRWNGPVGGVNVGQTAFEGEAYLGRWTLRALAGVEFGNTVSGTINGLIYTYDVRTRFFDHFDVGYYVQDDWKVFVGHRYTGGRNALALGTEFAAPLGRGGMASFFVEGRIGDSDASGVWGGIRFYAGQKDKSLMRRHREDDPVEVPLGGATTGGTSAGAGTPAAPACLPPRSINPITGICEIILEPS
jgi:hypothetical protein